MKLDGKRIFLRPWRESDAEDLVALLNDKSIANFTRVPNPYKLKHARKKLKECREKWRKKQEAGFAIISKKEKKLLGSIDIMDIDKHSRKAHIGYLLGKEFRGKGFMQEAIQLVLGFAFKNLKLNRIRISCFVKNKASRKVIEKTGAKFEGIERDGIKSGLGKLHDVRVYSILAREFKRKDI